MSKNLCSTTNDLQWPSINRDTKDEKSPPIQKNSPKAVQKKKNVGKNKNELYPFDENDDEKCKGSFESEEVEENVDGNVIADSTPSERNNKEKSPDVGLRKRTNKDDSHDPNKSKNALTEEKFEKLDTKKEKRIPYLWLVILSGLIFGVVLFLTKDNVLLYIYPQNTNKEITNYNVFKSHFDKIKDKYPSQTRKFWQTIGASIKRVLTQTASTYPAVILIAVPKGHSETGTCISNEIIKTFNKVFNFSTFAYINSANLKLSYPAKAKLDLDDHFLHYLSNGKGIVLDYVNLLPAQCGLLLHGYCDGDNAPFKDVVILLTLHTDHEFQDLYDNKVEDILTQMWEHDLGIDEMPALRSRIANNIAILSPESNFVCQ